MHDDISGPLRRKVRDYLVREQDQRGINSVEWARVLGINQSMWSRLRNGNRNVTLEILCRAIIACPSLLITTVTFFSSLVKVHHEGGAGIEQTEGERSDDRQPAVVR